MVRQEHNNTRSIEEVNQVLLEHAMEISVDPSTHTSGVAPPGDGPREGVAASGNHR
jgi:hypothetical protein